MNRGFSLLEIVIALGIIILVSAVIASSLSGFRNSGALDEATDTVVTTLHEAREFTLSSREASTWGVHFEAGQIVLFKGSSYSGSDPDNEVHIIESPATIADISLTGGGSDLVFDRLTGETSQSGTIRVEISTDSSASSTITILSTGVIESN